MTIKLKFLLISVLALLLLISGCGKSSNEKGEGKSDIATITINGGQFITKDGQENSNDSALLALNVSITNHSGESLDLLSDDFSLYDSKNEKVSVDESIYDSEGDFKTLSTDSLAKDKTVTGYLPFRVAKNKSYELHFQPDVYKEDKKSDEIIVKINTKPYKDNQQQIKDAMNAYVQTVFFSKNDPNYAKLVANDATKDKAQLKERFIKNMGSELEDQLSDQQTDQIYDAFISTNRDKGSVELNVDTALPNSAVVEVTPKVLFLSDMYDEVEKLKDQFIDDNRGNYSDYNAAMKGWYAYMAKNMGEVFKNTDTRTADSTYKINLKKEGEKWQVNSEKSTANYDYEDLLNDMTGGY
ncbi:DUF5105 domain-containing protein [Sporolactobacillus sp. STCC-11]|uniref:DUF5105 domain-containing protein n=1 Tax=Sporolactobacillus caesalpiniae TaxID=3230362 RepID=UPI003393656E